MSVLWRALLATAAIAAVIALAYTALSFQYSWGTMAQPGTGFLPFWVGALLLVSAAGVAWEAVSEKSTEAVDWPTGLPLLRVAAVVLIAVGYIVVLSLVGHAIAGTLAAAALMTVMGGRPILIVPIALLAGIGSSLLFVDLLGVPLPSGLFFE